MGKSFRKEGRDRNKTFAKDKNRVIRKSINTKLKKRDFNSFDDDNF